MPSSRNWKIIPGHMADRCQTPVPIQISNSTLIQWLSTSTNLQHDPWVVLRTNQNKVRMSDAASITYCDNRVAIEDPKADKIFEKYRYCWSLRGHLPKTCNPRETGEITSGKEACEAILLQFKSSDAASAGTAQFVPEITLEKEDISCLPCGNTPWYCMESGETVLSLVRLDYPLICIVQ